MDRDRFRRSIKEFNGNREEHIKQIKTGQETGRKNIMNDEEVADKGGDGSGTFARFPSTLGEGSYISDNRVSLESLITCN